MWEIDYTEEVKFYFIDNGDLVFDLLVRIEELKYAPDGLPDGEWIELEPEIFLWSVLRHFVVYQRSKAERKLRIAVVKPMA